MSPTRGAAAPTSGSQDLGTFDEKALDRSVSAVAQKASEWAPTSTRERTKYIDRIVIDTMAVAEEWNAAACLAKGLDPKSTEGGEELFSGVGTFINMAQLFRRSLIDITLKGRPQYPGPVRHQPGERISVQVVPATLFDRLLFAGVSAQVWMEPGVNEDEVRSTQGEAYQTPLQHVGVSLVLGAGNVGSLGPRDALSKMFEEGHVVVLKANPVNDYLVPYWTAAFASLIDAGYLAVVSGGAHVGSFLTHHELISDIHVTGSDKTHDAIVYGVGEEGARRKAADVPDITKPISSELGNVSPVVIVPGEWTDKEIAYQARHVATMVANNAGFNCLTPRVIITHAAWAQREQFFTALEAVFAILPTRRAYYPGTQERRASFLAVHPNAHEIGDDTGDTMPWTIVRDVDSSNVNDICLNVEVFCALTSETALAATSPADFVEKAVAFCNDVVWGTLSMTIIADPRSMKDPVTGPAIERAISELRYGSIGVNLWHALSYAFAATVWGAYPGHLNTDIQSGSGFVGNAYTFARPQKSVVRGPFISKPTPAWFATNRNGGVIMAKLLDFQAKPSWSKIPSLLAASFKG